MALITGGDSGIGRAVAYLFSIEGATVAFTYVPGDEEKDAEDTVDIIKKNKCSDAKDPLKIAMDLGFDDNCKKVSNVCSSRRREDEAKIFCPIDRRQSLRSCD